MCSFCEHICNCRVTGLVIASVILMCSPSSGHDVGINKSFRLKCVCMYMSLFVFVCSMSSFGVNVLKVSQMYSEDCFVSVFF